MEKNKTYKVEKSFKVDTTDGNAIELKDARFVHRDSTENYYVISTDILSIPLLVSKKDIDNRIEKGSIVEESEFTDLNLTVSYNLPTRTPITEESILPLGFVRKSGLYIKGDESLQLIKGHTWHYCIVGYKFGKDVKFTDEIIKHPQP